MRDHRFRAWDKLNEIMCDVEVLDFVNKNVVLSPPAFGVIAFKDFELLQYTGRKDKNGKEIYREDWIKWDKMDDVMLVDFWYGKWVLVHRPTCGAEREGECKHDNLYDFAIDEIEIVGNTFQNKNLLDG